MILTILMILAFCGCGKKSDNRQTTTIEETAANQRYNNTDTAVVIGIDLEEMHISLSSLSQGTTYTLSYSGGTKIRSKNDVELTMSQIAVGELVDVYDVLGSQRLIEMRSEERRVGKECRSRWS